jgi:hypothetical protein
MKISSRVHERQFDPIPVKFSPVAIFTFHFPIICIKEEDSLLCCIGIYVA